MNFTLHLFHEWDLRRFILRVPTILAIMFFGISVSCDFFSFSDSLCAQEVGNEGKNGGNEGTKIEDSVEPLELDLSELGNFDEEESPSETKDEKSKDQKSEQKSEPKRKVQSVLQPETDSDAAPETTPETDSETDSDAAPETASETKPATNPAVKSKTNPTVKPTVKPAATPVAQPELNAARVPLEQILPADSAVIFRVASVRKMNERLETITETNVLKLLKTLGQGEYAKQVEPDRPVGAALFPMQNTFQWVAAVPLKNYRKFITLLGADANTLPAEIPDGTVSVLSPTLCAAPYRGYALLAANPMILARIQRGAKFGDYCRYTPCAVKDPTLSLELTNVFFRFLVSRGRIGMEEFAPVFSPEMLGIQEGSEQMALARQYFDKINDSITWLDANIASFRLDLSIGAKESVLSSSYLPKPETRLAELIQDPFIPIISTTLDGGSFLKVAPLYPSALCGQADIPPSTAERLQAPFNRIRHVEYSFITPPETGRLAEAWCFFLEVNDSEAFVREMIIPKAEEVGTQFGANTLAEIGGDAAQRAAEKRQERQMNRRRPPRRPADPEAAAARGERLGGLIGGLIGGAVAKNTAMKKQDFMGYDLYVSDLVQFTQLKKRIREQQQGTAPPTNLFGGGTMRPSQMIGTVISGLISGDMNLDMSSAMGEFSHETPGDPPMAATRNFIVVLGPNHLLIVPGNDYVLYDAVRRWEWVKTQYLPPQPPPTPEQLDARRRIPPYVPAYGTTPVNGPLEESTAWHASWNSICEMIANPNMHALRFAAILTPSETLNTLDFAAQTYNFEIKDEFREQLSSNLPPFLSVYTTTGRTGCTFTTIPNEMGRAQFQKLIMNLPQLLSSAKTNE